MSVVEHFNILYLYETPIYFSNSYYLLIILLLEVFQRELHMSFNFGEEIWIIKGSPKWVLQLTWWVQMFGLLLFDSMLFFGPSFSHLICYFGFFCV